MDPLKNFTCRQNNQQLIVWRPLVKKMVTYKIIRDRILPMPDKGSLFSSPLSLSRSAATAVRYWLKTSVTWRLYSLRAVANSSGRSSKITFKGMRYVKEKQKPKNKQWESSVFKSIGKLMLVKQRNGLNLDAAKSLEICCGNEKKKLNKLIYGIQFVLRNGLDTYSYFSNSKTTAVTKVCGKCQIVSLQWPVNKQLSPVFQMMDNSLSMWINFNKIYNAIHHIEIYPADSVIHPLKNRCQSVF